MTALASIGAAGRVRRVAPEPGGEYAPLGLREDPFPPQARSGAWIDLPSRAAAATAIRAFLEGGQPGLAIVGGVAGSGKTRFLDHLAREIDGRLSGIVPDEGSRRSDAQLLRACIAALGGVPTGRTGLELATGVRSLLDAHRDDPRMPVLWIDNAALTGSQLEIVRSILASPEDETRVQVVLLGPVELEDRVARRRSLARFLRESVTLHPLDEDETGLLVEERIGEVRLPDQRREIFAPGALEALWQATDGVPGAIVTLAHRCLREAVATGVTRIDRTLVTTIAESPGAGSDDPAVEGPIQTRLTLPGLAEPVERPRRRGRQR